ncbi:MAG: TetR family transcriptional regulator [Dermatophilaceae bacterium]
MPTDAQPAPRRRGPRTGGQDTRAAIIEAARAEFAAKGYDGATLRGIARTAGVDPRLVHHYFDGKQNVFQEVLHMPVHLDEVIEGVFTKGSDGLGERVLRTFFAVWDAPGASERLVAFVASASSGTDNARTMQQFLAREVLSRITRFARADDPQLRASLVASQLLGIAIARYVLKIEPIASADPEVLVPFLAPTLERYLHIDPEAS